MEQRHPIAKVDPFTNDGLGQLAPGSGGCRGSGRDASAVPHRFDALAAPQEKHVTSAGALHTLKTFCFRRSWLYSTTSPSRASNFATAPVVKAVPRSRNRTFTRGVEF
jgi:hypothetical protein